jgi:hypothetical protein
VLGFSNDKCAGRKRRKTNKAVYTRRGEQRSSNEDVLKWNGKETDDSYARLDSWLTQGPMMAIDNVLVVEADRRLAVLMMSRQTFSTVVLVEKAWGSHRCILVSD